MNKLKILVVDDNEGMRDTLRMVLEFEDFIVSCCDSGATALEVVKEKNFEIIIIDYSMPGMRGDEVTKMLRPLCPDAFIVGCSLDFKAEAFINAGADAFVVKDELIEKLMLLIKHRHSRYDLMNKGTR